MSYYKISNILNLDYAVRRILEIRKSEVQGCAWAVRSVNMWHVLSDHVGDVLFLSWLLVRGKALRTSAAQ